jgi:eukaryotic-like serine/threonine-protein kinase
MMRARVGKAAVVFPVVLFVALGVLTGGCTVADRGIPDPGPSDETPAETPAAPEPVADGVPMIVVPAVSGMTATDADTIFQQAGLAPSVIGVYTDSGPVGFVVDQYPRAGHEVASDEVAVLVVSFGARAKRGILVPQVEGVQLQMALDRLGERGLRAEVHYRDHHIARDGTVLLQAPPPDTTMDESSAVVLVIARSATREEPELP